MDEKQREQRLNNFLEKNPDLVQEIQNTINDLTRNNKKRIVSKEDQEILNKFYEKFYK